MMIVLLANQCGGKFLWVFILAGLRCCAALMFGKAAALPYHQTFIAPKTIRLVPSAISVGL
jgi:hypothetical protein